MAIGPKGIDVRQTTGQLVFRVSLKDAAGNLVTTGTTTLRLFEIQSDGTLKIYDWNANTFGSTGTAPTTDGLALTHRTYKDQSNVTQNMGVWTGILSTLTGFTAGGVYICQITNTGAAPAQQEREFQFGLVQGDDGLTTTQKADVLAALSGKLGAVANDGTATLLLKGIEVVQTTTDGNAVKLVGNGLGNALWLVGGAGGRALLLDADGLAAFEISNLSGHGINISGGSDASAQGIAISSIGGGGLSIDKPVYINNLEVAVSCLLAGFEAAATAAQAGDAMTLTNAYDPAKTAAQAGNAMTLTAAYDLYYANIWFTRDVANSRDEYTVTWFKNGVPLVAGITNPKLTVTLRSNDTVLISDATMTAFGATGSFKYDSPDPAMLADGDAALASVSATIDAVTRTFSRLIGRDG